MFNDEQQQTLKELSSQVEAYFKELSYSATTISRYRSGWKKLDEFMKDKSIEFYSSMVGEMFIKGIIGTGTYDDLSRWNKDLIRCANVLSEFQATGVIQFRSHSKFYVFEGEIGNVILGFISYRESLGLSKDTLDSNRLYLARFLDYLNTKCVQTIKDLEKHHILGFINSLGFYSKATIHCTLCSLRNFLKYLYENQYSGIDFVYLVPKDNYKQEAKLPTTYTKEEVEKLISAVDRCSPKGKRDVTMILLAARLGLRASDICHLQFENILWETNTISLMQKKTGEKVELPLLMEIGTAIIDYLKYGRPVSELPYIFLRIGQPYNKLEEPTLHSIVSFYLRRAGISHVDKKKHGPHALRHSLAGFLMEKKTPLPIISEVLGHSNTESTKPYLRIDMEALRQCSLEVPPLESPYYKEVV